MLNVGDLVIDRDSEDPEAMRVINPDVGIAKEVKIEDLGKSVYQVNPTYSPKEQVVETVYESWLESYVPHWKEWSINQLDVELQEYTSNWSVSISSYYYPRNRLKLIE